MTNVYQLRNDEHNYEQASLWVARIDRGLTNDEIEQLHAWLAADSRNRSCLFELASLWDRMDSLALLSELFDPPVAKQSRSGWLSAGWAVAASITALALGLVLLLPDSEVSDWQEPDFQEAGLGDNVYETGLGVHSSVNLPDGTRMTLNTNTRVSVNYTEQERLLVLDRGEVHVEVAHEPARPLRVRAGGKQVEAVGTAFNVHLVDERRFELIVTEGKVRIDDYRPELSQADKLSEPRHKEPARVLEKGQRMLVDSLEQTSAEPASASSAESIGEEDIHAKLSWRDGNLVFRGETLEEALAELSRYTPVTFEIEDEELTDLRIAGLFKTGDVQGLLTALKENFNIEYDRPDDQRVRLRAGG